MHPVILEAVDSLESSCNREWAKTKAVVVDGVLGLVSLQETGQAAIRCRFQTPFPARRAWHGIS